MTTWDADPFAGPRGYRPYHDRTCPARDARVPVDRLRLAPGGGTYTERICTCGGLDHPAWDPGDEPTTPL